MLLKRYKYIFFTKLAFLSIGMLIFGYLFFNNNKNHKEQDGLEKKIVFILDVSHSMNTNDIKSDYGIGITRLQAAKNLINKYIEQHKDYKFGLILFSRKSNYFIPPTFDKETLTTYIKNINTNIIPSGGSNIIGGIQDFISNTSPSSIAILISDFGEKSDFNEQKNQINELIKQKNKNNQHMIIYGLGTNEGSIVTFPNQQPIKKDGKAVISRFNQEYAQFLSEKLNSKLIKIENINKNYEISSNTISETPNNTNTSNKILEMIGILSTIIGL